MVLQNNVGIHHHFGQFHSIITAAIYAVYVSALDIIFISAAGSLSVL
jgi:hypothetical protein